MTHQLLQREAAGVAVVVGVGEDPVVAPVQGLDLAVVLAVQRGLTSRLVLEQLHLVLVHREEASVR